VGHPDPVDQDERRFTSPGGACGEVDAELLTAEVHR
jgi:hypothetical protein